MPQLALSAGVIDYDDAGGPGPVVVLVHGLLMDGAQWRHVVADLRRDHRCVLPTLPMGAHRRPMRPDAELSLRGLGRILAEFMERLGLRDVALCFNDWCGAQVMIADGGVGWTTGPLRRWFDNNTFFRVPVERGATELRRIARRRIVVLTWDPHLTRQFWLLSEYLPQAAAFDDARAVPLARLARLLGGARIEPVPVPHDCTDGFAAAYWRRPRAYLDLAVRAGISMLAQLADDVLRPGLRQLSADLDSGRWHERHRDLLRLEQFDAGYRLLIADQ